MKMLITVFIALFVVNIQAQDMAKVGKEKPFSISGGLGFNYTTTIANDSNRIPMPQFWSGNLNVNLSVYGFSIPVSAIITNGKVSLTHAFNQFGLSPTYKWLTFHAGYRQFQYSPFTVSGQTFFGAGFELRPSFLRLGFFVGRLRKAAEIDSSVIALQTIPGSYPLNVVSANGVNYYTQQPSYTRKGWGAKLGFGHDNNFVDFIVFRGHDNINSLKNNKIIDILKPEDNLILGINIFQRFLKHISMGLNGAASIYTFDTSVDPLTLDIPMADVISKFVPIRSTTQVQFAGEVNLNLNYPNFSLNTSYKRAEPNYRSMGISSFVTDYSLFSIQPSWNLYKQKIRFTNIIQMQSDNLNNYKQFTTYRKMYNSSVSMNLSNLFGIDINYNRNGITQKKAENLLFDSLQSSQQSQTYTVSPRLLFSTPTFSDVISLVSSYTTMESVLPNKMNNNLTNVYATLNNTFVLYNGGWNINAGLNYNSAVTSLNSLKSFGFIAGVSKGLFDNKFTLTNNNTVLWNTLDNVGNGNTVSIDLSAVYNFLLRHTISIAVNYLFSPANGIYNLNDFQQTRIMAAYQFSF